MTLNLLTNKNSGINLKMITPFFLLLFIFSSCLIAQNDKIILAQKNGMSLTNTHLHIFTEGLISDGTLKRNSSQEEINQIKEELLAEFDSDPSGTLDFIEYYNDMLERESASTINSKNEGSFDQIKTSTSSDVSAGNQRIRDILGKDIGQMQFDVEKANSFRSYMKNSLLYDSSTSFSQYSNGSNYANSSAKIYFCADGTYTQILSGSISIDVENISAYSGDDDDEIQRGVWETAYLPSGVLILLLYSTDQSMLEDSPNGFLPFPIASYTDTYVVMPDGSIPYQRESGHTCN